MTRSHGSVGRTIWYRLKNPLLRDALLVVHTVICNRKIASKAVTAKPHQIDIKILDFQGFSSFLGTFSHFRGVQNTPPVLRCEQRDIFAVNRMPAQVSVL